MIAFQFNLGQAAGVYIKYLILKPGLIPPQLLEKNVDKKTVGDDQVFPCQVLIDKGFPYRSGPLVNMG